MATSLFQAFRALEDGRHRAELYRMWARGHDAGLAHPASLEMMGERESPPAEKARQWLLRGTRRGVGIADAVRPADAPFEDLERALLTFGDESGHLDDALRLLGDFFTAKHRLMLQVKKELTYPLFTGIAACFIAPLPILFLGGPAFAYIVTALAGVAWILLGAGALITAVATRFGRKPALARARMARALATAIEAGLPLPRAIRLAAEASAHPEIRAYVHRATDRGLGTRSIGESLAGCPHLTPEFLGVLDTAERTGDFKPLARLAELYEDGFR